MGGTTLRSTASQAISFEPQAPARGGRLGRAVAMVGALVAVGVVALLVVQRSGSRSANEGEGSATVETAPATAPAPRAAPPVAPAVAAAPAGGGGEAAERGRPAESEQVSIEVQDAPPNLEVSIDGGQPRRLPALLRRGSGTHALLFEAPGYRSKSLTLDAVKDLALLLSLKRVTATAGERRSPPADRGSRRSAAAAGPPADRPAAPPHPSRRRRDRVPSPIFEPPRAGWAKRRAVAGAGAGALLIALCAGAVAPRAALAATADEAARAKVKLQSGARALDEGDYEQALSLFQEAFQIVPSPKIQFNFGLAYEGMARHADALEAFERFVSEAKQASPATRADAEKHIAALRRRVGTVSITADADGAEVRLDGRKLGDTPLEKKIYVQAGPHQLVVRRGDGAPFVQDFTAVAGGESQIAAKVMAAARPEPVLRAPPPEQAAPPALVDRPEDGRSNEAPSGGRWLLWGIVGGVVVAAAVAAVLVLGRSTSYPKTDGTVAGN
jgi:hypothetical protein